MTFTNYRAIVFDELAPLIEFFLRNAKLRKLFEFKSHGTIVEKTIVWKANVK